MNTYIAVITTVLVITQLIRLTQNAFQLKRQKVLYEKQLGQLSDITEEDLQIQKRFYRKGLEFFEAQSEDGVAEWERTGNYSYRCSKCMAVHKAQTEHCPDCGREMYKIFGI